MLHYSQHMWNCMKSRDERLVLKRFMDVVVFVLQMLFAVQLQRGRRARHHCSKLKILELLSI